jgi:hypothetical protein
MAPKKLKRSTELSPLEKALKEKERATKAAQRKDSEVMLPLKLGITPEAARFYYRNPKHKYGTCWQCGVARLTPGGVPGGRDAYWCASCGQYLVVRNLPSDACTIAISEEKTKKSSRGRQG